MDLPGPPTDKNRGHGTLQTEKQLAFCREYVKDWCGTEAAKRAGFSAKTANVKGSELLSQPNVRAEIKRIVDEYVGDQREEIRYRVVAALKDIGLETKDPPVPMVHKLKALEMLGKFAVLFVEKVEVSGGLDPVQNMTPEERRALIASLLAKRGSA